MGARVQEREAIEPANDIPDLRRIDALAREYGFPSTQAFRKWCGREGITVHIRGKLGFVDRRGLVEAIMGASRPAPKPRARSDAREISDAIEATIRGRRA